MQSNKAVLPDASIGRFEKAIALLQDAGPEATRDALYDMLRTFPDSTRAAEAKRIIGEINMDALFSGNQNTSRKDYAVQPGDSLGLIARKNQTTVECLLRANNMMSAGLQPGDHLFVFPLDFSIEIHAGAKTLTLLRNGRFFKEYQAVELKLPAGTKFASNAPPPKPDDAAPKAEPVKLPPSKSGKGNKKGHVAAPAAPPGEFTVNDKAAWVEGKRVQSTDSRFNAADKWLMTSRTGFNIRAMPAAQPAPEAGLITTTTITATAKSSAKQQAAKSTKTAKSAKSAKSMSAAEDDSDDATATAPQTGFFLTREDAEELFTLIRTGTAVKIFK
jgi:LysM repeat protein